jgi:hypothetical protein
MIYTRKYVKARGEGKDELRRFAVDCHNFRISRGGFVRPDLRQRARETRPYA